MSTDKSEGKVQLWVNVETRRRLKGMAARKDKTMLEMVEISSQVYKILEEVAERSGKTVNEVLEEIGKENEEETKS